MYTTIINPYTNRKVNISSKLGRSIIHNYLNYLQRGGMHVGFIYINLKKSIQEKDPETYNWLVEKRLNKPKGVLTFIINELSKEKQDTVVEQKIKKIADSVEEINEIIKQSLPDIGKKDKILQLLEEDLPELESIPVVHCKVCG